MRRLKSDGPFPGLFVPLTILVVFISMVVLFDVKAAYYALSAITFFFAITTFIAYFQLRSTNLLVIGGYQTSVSLLCLSAPRDFKTHGDPHPETILFLVLMFVFAIATFYLMVNKKVKWRGRDILELAAIPVEVSDTAFTDRPRPVGKVDTNERELRNFAEFLKRNLIAMPLYEENRIVFLPMKEGWDSGIFIFRVPKSYIDRTWIAFDYDGNVTVSISKTDYLLYQEDLSFDQLCSSMGNVFIDFLDLFSNGKAVRIIDKLNAMPTTIFS
jgi:hypothetical protein